MESLLEQFKEDFIVMNKLSTADGEGGFTTTWQNGAEIVLYPWHNSTIAAQVAESENTASTYTFLHDVNLKFELHDVIKRKSDGQTFRVTAPSHEEKTPASSRLNLSKFMAEKWEVS